VTLITRLSDVTHAVYLIVSAPDQAALCVGLLAVQNNTGESTSWNGRSKVEDSWIRQTHWVAQKSDRAVPRGSRWQQQADKLL